ncbi:hypothetical protein AUJ66_05170 [Candidatus Desantisbacteria bacterium CG1_02_38_46]|uniref:DUF4412 domain-containing protein n=1 Tax=Candidatus Desantisbacteria bacterium CG1_02_38_46 TaxID=1817893 RepID=A0A1J4SBQ4_9BACT|nr:MAG: hypothetical protein AUJ66_05170 [Candidatus Desantisbacteria bacterium CG1_02_38_46]
MKRRIFKFIVTALAFFVSATPLIAEDAFSTLDNLEKNYVGIEKAGLNTLIAKALTPAYPETAITVYWSREKGLKVKAEGGGPAAMGAGLMVESFVRAAGLGLKKSSEEFKLTKETVDATIEAGTLEDGTKVSVLTFIPKKGQDLDFKKMVVKVDGKKWLVRQMVLTTKEGEEVITNITYNKDGLFAKMVSSVGKVKTTMTTTYGEKGKFTVPAKQVIEMEGPNVPEEMKSMTITYSDVEVNAKIPEDVFAEPKVGDVPKPTETAAQLFQQAQAAMQKGDMDTAKLKLRQIVTYYPNDPMATAADMMFKQLPK